MEFTRHTVDLIRRNDKWLICDVDKLMEIVPENIEELGRRSLRIDDWEELSTQKKDSCMLQLQKLARLSLLRDDPLKPPSLYQLDCKIRDWAPMSVEQLDCLINGRKMPPNGDYVEQALRYGVEKEAYDMLLKEGGIPSHPIELEQGALKIKQKHDGLAKYWQREMAKRNERGSFSTQVLHWEKFQSFQFDVRNSTFQNWRRYKIQAQDRCRKYKLVGDVIYFNKDLDHQDRLSTWLEYQCYHHRKFEKLGASIEDEREDLITKVFELNMENLGQREPATPTPSFHAFRNPLRDAWKIKDPEEIRAPLAIVIERLDDLGFLYRAMWYKANMTLCLAEHRLLRASRLSSDTVHREAWVQKLEAEVKQREDKSIILQENLEGSPDHWTGAEGDALNLELTRNALEAARTDFENTIDKRVLMSNIQREVQMAKHEVETVKRAWQIAYYLRGPIRDSKLRKLLRDYENYHSLLHWIEKQRQLIPPRPPIFDFRRDQKEAAIQKERNTGQENDVIKARDGLKQQSQHKSSPDENVKRLQNRLHFGPSKPETTAKRLFEDNLTEKDSPKKKQKGDPEPTTADNIKAKNGLKQQPQIKSSPDENVKRLQNRIYLSSFCKSKTTTKRPLEDSLPENDSPGKKQKRDSEPTTAKMDEPNHLFRGGAKAVIEDNEKSLFMRWYVMEKARIETLRRRVMDSPPRFG